jgi:hypothetical protein
VGARVVGYKTSEEIGGVLTMEQFIPEEKLTPEQEERRKLHEYFEKKYGMTPPNRRCFFHTNEKLDKIEVAPLAGVWVEIRFCCPAAPALLRRSPCGSMG